MSSDYNDHLAGVKGAAVLLRQAASSIETHGVDEFKYWVNETGEVKIEIRYQLKDEETRRRMRDIR